MKPLSRILWAALPLLAVFACSDNPLFVEPAPRIGTAAVAVSFSVAPASGSQGGPGEAYDKADSVRVQITRSDNEIAADTVLPFGPSGSETRLQLAVGLERAGEVFGVAVQLRWQGQPVFAGSTQVTLQAGQTTQTDLTLQPVIAAVRGPESVPAITAIGSTIQLQGAAVFATGDTVPGVALTWTSLDPGVVEVGTNGAATARSEGQARVQVAHQALADTVLVPVQAGVASVEVSPASATLFPDSTQQFQAVARDANGSVLVRAIQWESSDPGVATVDANGLVRGVAPGGPVTIRATVGTTTGTAQATVIAAPVIAVSRGDISFSAVQGQANPVAQTVTVSNTGDGALTGLNGIVTYGAGQPQGWLAASLNSTTAPATLTLQPSIAGLQPGTYTANVTVRSSLLGVAPRTVEVSLVVVAPPVITLSPTSMTFGAVQQQANPAAQTVSVTNSGGGSLTGLSGTVTYTAGQNWLSASLNSTTAPATLTLQPNTTDLAPGMYRATVAVRSDLPLVADQTVEVTYVLAPASPGAPSSLSASASGTQVNLSWQDNSEFESEFRIERSSSGGSFSRIATVPGGTTTYADPAAGNTRYVYRVQACNPTGCSNFSNEAGASTVPDAPSELTAQFALGQAGSSVVLSWRDNSDVETGFQIERRVGPSGTWNVLTTVGANVTGFSDTGVTSGTTYSYRVRACNPAGCSMPSNEPSATTGALPTATTGTATEVLITSALLNGVVNPNGLPTTVIFQWTDSASFSASRLESIRNTPPQNVGSGTSPVAVRQAISGLEPNTTHAFRVVAQNALGTVVGEPVTFTTAQAPVATVVVVPSNASIQIGGTVDLDAVALSATGDTLSGRPVIWESLNGAVASVSATGLVTGLQAGTATIRATSEGQSGEATVTVSAAPSIVLSPSAVSLTAQVNETATGTIGVSNGGGGTLGGLNGIVTYGAEQQTGWLEVALSSTTAPATLTLTANAEGLAPGTYNATVTVRSSTEGVAEQAATVTFTVTQVPVATVRVVPDTATITVNGTVDLDAVALSSSGDTLTGRPVTWASLNPGIATVSSTGLVTGIAPGTATIRATSEGQSGNATITVVPSEPVPAAPSNLTASPDQWVYVRWQDNSTNESEFRIERKTGVSGTYALLATVPGDTVTFREYVDQSVADDATVYLYRVQACNAGGCSPYSNEAATPPVVSTDSATNIQTGQEQDSQATVWGHVDPNSADYTVWFEYAGGYLSSGELFAQQTGATPEQSGTTAADWSALLTSSYPAVGYRIVVRGGERTEYGDWKCVEFGLGGTNQNMPCTVYNGGTFSRAGGANTARLAPQRRTPGVRSRLWTDQPRTTATRPVRAPPRLRTQRPRPNSRG